MSNSILNSNNNKQIAPRNIAPNNLVQRFQQFKNSLKGNPRQIVMNMVQSGQITEGQLQQAMSQAQQMQGLFR